MAEVKINKKFVESMVKRTHFSEKEVERLLVIYPSPVLFRDSSQTRYQQLRKLVALWPTPLYILIYKSKIRLFVCPAIFETENQQSFAGHPWHGPLNFQWADELFAIIAL
jgi:hypothetical protein